MSISTGPLGAMGQFATYDPHVRTMPWPTLTLHCRRCGDRVGDDVVPPLACPRCHSGVFEHIAMSRSRRRLTSHDA